MRYLNFNELNNGASLKSSIDDADLSDFNKKRLDFYKELNKFFKKNPELLKKIMSKYNSIGNRKMNEVLTLRNILSKHKINDNDYEEIKEILKGNDNRKTKVLQSTQDITNNHPVSLEQNITTIEAAASAAAASAAAASKRLEEKKDTMAKPENLEENLAAARVAAIVATVESQNGGKNNILKGGSLEEYYDNNNDKIKYNKEKENDKKKIIKAIKKKYDLNFQLEEDKNFQEESNPMQKFINDYYNANKKYKKNIKEENKEGEKKLKQALIKAVDDFDNNPINPLDILSIKNDDRIVFIAITFIIRYVSLLLVNWCVEIDIIKSFNHAFILFTFIYIIIFWLIVMIINVNISPELSGESSIIGKVQSVLYYFHFRINDIGRLLVHTLLILLLLLIPIIVKSENKINDDPLTYDERIKLYNTLSLFTIFMWLFTSLIATKY